MQCLPTSSQIFTKLSYRYPLKLLSPHPVVLSVNEKVIHTLFLLSYGGGLVAGDSIDLEINLARYTRLILLTQGSTKVFRSPNECLISSQRIQISVRQGSALCYIPEPVQPFRESSYEQNQIFDLETGHQASLGLNSGSASLFACDWTSDGRRARNEHWDFRKYTSKLEVWGLSTHGKRKLLLRDKTALEAHASKKALVNFSKRFDECGIFGTMLICGPVFVSLERFFRDLYALRRISEAEQFGTTSDKPSDAVHKSERNSIVEEENENGIVWTASTVRGIMVVKFSANSVEGAKKWMRMMLSMEGTLAREFGERATMPLS